MRCFLFPNSVELDDTGELCIGMNDDHTPPKRRMPFKRFRSAGPSSAQGVDLGGSVHKASNSNANNIVISPAEVL